MLQGRIADKHCILEFFSFQKELELKMSTKRYASDSSFAEILVTIVIQLVVFSVLCKINYFLCKRKENNLQFITYSLISVVFFLPLSGLPLPLCNLLTFFNLFFSVFLNTSCNIPQVLLQISYKLI